ncbi:hypothetical protein MRB53_040385 [Persea americana]|nr:hypothetical protein MRB53_040385 [Persea americana]
MAQSLPAAQVQRHEQQLSPATELALSSSTSILPTVVPTLMRAASCCLLQHASVPYTVERWRDSFVFRYFRIHNQTTALIHRMTSILLIAHSTAPSARSQKNTGSIRMHSSGTAMHTYVLSSFYE